MLNTCYFKMRVTGENAGEFIDAMEENAYGFDGLEIARIEEFGFGYKVYGQCVSSIYSSMIYQARLQLACMQLDIDVDVVSININEAFAEEICYMHGTRVCEHYEEHIYISDDQLVLDFNFDPIFEDNCLHNDFFFVS